MVVALATDLGCVKAIRLGWPQRARWGRWSWSLAFLFALIQSVSPNVQVQIKASNARLGAQPR